MLITRLHIYYVLVLSIAKETIRVACDAPTSIPRSSHRPTSYTEIGYPPWNPSSSIDVNGFLVNKYRRIPGEWEKEFKIRKRHRIQTDCTIRQVPGDGNCLFHSISTCYAHAVNGTHLDLKKTDNLKWLYQNSARLRQQAVDCLQQKRKLLFLQGHEYLKSQELVDAAASQYGISGPEYCDLMRQDSYWGGGPEVVALCNVLQRPIHVYELFAKDNRFMLRRMACFGSPKYDRNQALHILSADSRFPDLAPGKQIASGNHFLAMFPEEPPQGKQNKRIRGGDVGADSSSSSSTTTTTTFDDTIMKEEETDTHKWWSRMFSRYRST
jgi:hypothetical protein